MLWVVESPRLDAAPAPGDAALAAYFQAETARVEAGPLAGIQTREAWESWRSTARQQLREMLGLEPFPERTPLHAVRTGMTEGEGIVVERLHFQSMPGLYVTANLYRPKEPNGKLPAILYLSGHGAVKKDGVSYGNKVHYQHHGIWFARHGYVCLILDTVQMGEMEGIHHGTYREGMWWWNSRGYTSAGAEAWNCIRALDYLQSRPEVDGERIGATGRSGGGAYSWWVSALDDRVKVTAPVAGITDLHNHVVDGVVEGHCDCMFMVNTHRWDYPEVAALVAPRPLLIVNTDSDTIFPLDGVVRTHAALRPLYRLLGQEASLGLVIGPGPHKDTQDLQVPVFRWMYKHLKGEDPVIDTPALPAFDPEALKVFASLPTDERTTHAHDTFVPMAGRPEVPDSAGEWAVQRDAWMKALRERCFGGWPEAAGALPVKTLSETRADGMVLSVLEFSSQEHVPLRLYLLVPAGDDSIDTIHLRVIEDRRFPQAPKPGDKGLQPTMRSHRGWPRSYDEMVSMLSSVFPQAMRDEVEPFGDGLKEDPNGWIMMQSWLLADRRGVAFFLPRGEGYHSWNPDTRKQIQIRRRFMLLGQTLHGMRVWDIRRAVEALRTVPGTEDKPLTLAGREWSGVDVLYASLYVTGLAGLSLVDIPASHMEGPDYLNVLRFLDIPQTLALAAERCPVTGLVKDPRLGSYAYEVGQRLGWEKGRVAIGIDLSTLK